MYIHVASYLSSYALGMGKYQFGILAMTFPLSIIDIIQFLPLTIIIMSGNNLVIS